ncbi:hypothetical protein I79_018072 [Cricetulus griseus]|uniref:Uncharacterized protein n=1 Tax=Cricetulus griseus TaxID=10029 RepID=G3I3R2_CRIGR|nr:hypothetical protein I79_018072 [Cricetulus griseus]
MSPDYPLQRDSACAGMSAAQEPVPTSVLKLPSFSPHFSALGMAVVIGINKPKISNFKLRITF